MEIAIIPRSRYSRVRDADYFLRIVYLSVIGEDRTVDRDSPCRSLRISPFHHNFSTYFHEEVAHSVSFQHFGYGIATVTFGYCREVKLDADVILENGVSGDMCFPDACISQDGVDMQRVGRSLVAASESPSRNKR